VDWASTGESLPELIVLDLMLYIESGFEVLRRWREEPELRAIPIIVWTVMGEPEQSICGYFGVQEVLPKWAGHQRTGNVGALSSAAFRTSGQDDI
jgi:CheY-like chemotaxis protein